MNLSHSSQLIIDAGHLVTKAYNQCPDKAKGKRIAELLWQILGVAALVDNMTTDELHTKLLQEVPTQLVFDQFNGN